MSFLFASQRNRLLYTAEKRDGTGVIAAGTDVRVKIHRWWWAGTSATVSQWWDSTAEDWTTLSTGNTAQTMSYLGHGVWAWEWAAPSAVGDRVDVIFYNEVDGTTTKCETYEVMPASSVLKLTNPAAVGSEMGLASGAITSAKFSTDAISSAAVSAAAAEKVAAAVWEVDPTAHDTGSTFGVKLITAASAGTVTAAEVWAYASRALTDKAGFSISGTKQTLDALVDLSTTDVANAVLDAPLSSHTAGGSVGEGLNYLDAAISSRSTFDDSTDTVLIAADQSSVIIGTVQAVASLPSNTLAGVWNVVTGDITGGVGELIVSFLNALGTDDRPKISGDSHFGALLLTTPASVNILQVAGVTVASVGAFYGPVTDVTTLEADLAAVKAQTDVLTFSGSDVQATLAGELVTIASLQAYNNVAQTTELPVADATLRARLSSGRASNLDNLDAAVTTRAVAGDAMELTAGAQEDIMNYDLAAWEAAADTGTKLGNLLAGARAGVLGRMVLSGSTMIVYEVDGVTEIARFNIAANYASRTPV